MNAPNKTRSPWPIVLTIFFILLISGLVTLIIFSSTQHVDLVRADYYEEEIRYQDQLDRLQRTGTMGESIHVSYDPIQQCIRLQLPLAHAAESAGSIHLYRPSDARLDQHLPLSLDPHGSQTVDARQLRSGLWKVRLQWTLDGKEYFVDRPLVLPLVHRPS